MANETSTATAESKTSESAAEEKKAAASEEAQIEQYVQEHGEKELAGEEKSSAAAGESGKAEATASPALSKEDQEWLEVAAKSGVSRQDLLSYAQRGWEAQHGRSAPAEKKTGKDKSAESAEPGDEEFEPVTRAEFKAWQEQAESKTRLTVAAAQNQLKLEGFLAGHELTREDAETSKIVESKTYELMAGGKPLGVAFKEAASNHEDYLRRHQRGFIKKKIAQQKTRGESAAGEPATNSLPAFEHKATDFQDGTALDDALKVVQSDLRMAAGRAM